MRHIIGAIVICLGLAPSLVLSQSTETQADGAAADPAWIVVMHDPRSDRRRSRVGGVGYSADGSYDGDPQLNRAARSLASDFELTIVTQWPIRSLKVHCVVATLPANEAAADLIARLTADSRVASVQRMNTFESSGSIDPYRKLQTGLSELGIIDAHTYATGAGISVSVVDSGVDAAHPELDGAVVLQENLVDSAKMPAEQHGTGIAGVIAANTNNGVGVAGVAPDVDIQALRACWQADKTSAKAQCSTLTLSRALDRVIELKPQLLNMSLTGPYDPLLEELLSIVLKQNTIVVAAFDESRQEDKRFPLAQHGVFYARVGKPESESRAKNCLPAPGTDVLTVQPDNQYSVLQGNSLSAAHVSGVMALMLELHPTLSVDQLSEALNASVSTHGGIESISACRAIRNLDRAIDCPSKVDVATR